jgi:hypothetical protein
LTPSQLLKLLTTLASGALAAFFSFFFTAVFFFFAGFLVDVGCLFPAGFFLFYFGGWLGPLSSSLTLQQMWMSGQFN